MTGPMNDEENHIGHNPVLPKAHIPGNTSKMQIHSHLLGLRG